MFVKTAEGFWVRKDWITEIRWEIGGYWILYTKQQDINYSSMRFKNRVSANKWLFEQFGIKDDEV